MSIIPDGTKIIVVKVKGTVFPHSKIKVGEIGHIHEYDSSDDSYKITTDTHDARHPQTEVWIEATRIAPYVNEPVQATLENLRPLDVIENEGRIYLICSTKVEDGNLKAYRLKVHEGQEGTENIIWVDSYLSRYKILHNLGDIYRDI